MRFTTLLLVFVAFQAATCFSAEPSSAIASTAVKADTSIFEPIISETTEHIPLTYDIINLLEQSNQLNNIRAYADADITITFLNSDSIEIVNGDLIDSSVVIETNGTIYQGTSGVITRHEIQDEYSIIWLSWQSPAIGELEVPFVYSEELAGYTILVDNSGRIWGYTNTYVVFNNSNDLPQVYINSNQYSKYLQQNITFCNAEAPEVKHEKKIGEITAVPQKKTDDLINVYEFMIHR